MARSRTLGAVNPRIVRPLFRAVAIAEALSWTGLLIGMYIKYIADTSEVGVQVFGPIHGGLFMLYVAVTLLAWRVFRWSIPTLLWGLFASIPPLATIVFDIWAERSGRLDAPERDTAPAR
ncbi:DUF3817 domain-containing protein [Aeromicrobium piscarium]|uniref:DUF3817 domain-containing protein n=1 Tax=Aeromicrobium piscarium TaxID=2590901 RepID=A0A554SDI0_9ACTN|nr:DUF3817 domain-containing protein [Aeromicrobium piscarium]